MNILHPLVLKKAFKQSREFPVCKYIFSTQVCHNRFFKYSPHVNLDDLFHFIGKSLTSPSRVRNLVRLH